ncbi:CS1 type fimbrial major subunit [Edaphovirga cremea]|uniref:CS1 type fimbrial major subunit n=1 Tax=Edaphovirga cremea TaxID=2267246 RepID=UPI000DEFC17E|nr:CS1 type fimbrial major subunit [Edaphovirga cremea]
MKKILLSVVAAAILSTGMAHAADGVEKKINLVATINDAIYVSKPDGKSWYTTEELYAKDYTQTEFASNVLPVRIFSKAEKVAVSLVQAVVIHKDNGAEFKNVVVNFAGEPLPATGVNTITQTTQVSGNYDNIYNLQILADAPTMVVGDPAETNNGQYQGDLVMLFEPTI